MSPPNVERIFEKLQGFPSRGLEAAKELIWTELNYPRVNQVLSTRNWPEGTLKFIEEDPILIAKVGEEVTSFDIILTKLSEKQTGVGFPLSIVAERAVINQLIQDHPLALFVFTDPMEKHWHFVNVKQEYKTQEEVEKKRTQQRVIRRISIGPEERLRTAAERLALINLENIPADLFGLSPLEIQSHHDQAFDVRKVTEIFFQEYQQLFTQMQDHLTDETQDKHWAHDFALQFLNRVMFLYFVQRKRWLNNDPDFIDSYWKTYRKENRPADTFFNDWLNVMFFEAFNNQFQAGRSDRSYIPDEIREALALAPYLNGGLYKKNDIDTKYSMNISDAVFEKVLILFNQYNFTISEDTPLDQEVAVDPEMIGKVYESLVNVTDETDERGEAGIFYTPRVEIDLMCRLSLVDWMSNHLGEEFKSILYELVFAFDPEEKVEADKNVAQKELWNHINNLLNSIKVVDPACGSGSFLVGMLYVINDLSERASKQLTNDESPYERKKRLIGDCLYGVDVMDWAVHVAELRLWLQLVIETDLAISELQFKPLLPELSFNIRSGDSLVQEIGGINLSLLRKKTGLISSPIKKRITGLIKEKRKFYNNDPTCKFQDKKLLQQEELHIFRAIIDEQIIKNEKRLVELDQALQPRENMFGEQQTGQTKKDEKTLKNDQERISAKLPQLREARKTLKGVKDIPFVWDISFVEVFEGERQGFDLVIGNPPYVRQENIKDPGETTEQATTESKKIYKNKLRRSVYGVWPKSFGYDWATGKNSQNTIGLRSDLYLYFYFQGLALLNEKGSFCFVTSNSWLDVDYGTALQHFLLTRGKTKLIIDNEYYRSFESADVNTIIALLSKPIDNSLRIQKQLDAISRFVMLKIPYEQALTPIIWEEIESTPERNSLPEYRVFPIKQSALFESGMSSEEMYEGDKWGGKYLRAPDIFWTIMEKAKNKLVRLGDVADVRFGIKTGANNFFYLDEDKIKEWGIEEDFLKVVIKSPRECKNISIDPKDLKNKLFVCHRTKKELKGTAALNYIIWGEKQSYHRRPSTNSRKRWWDLGNHSPPMALWQKAFNDTFLYLINPDKVLASDRFYDINFHRNYSKYQITAALNNTFNFISTEINGRVNLGEGALDNMTYEAANNLIIDPGIIPEEGEIISREILPIPEELTLDDRHNLDKTIFDIFGLTEHERKSVYAEITKLVQARLKKATSV